MEFLAYFEADPLEDSPDMITVTIPGLATFGQKAVTCGSHLAEARRMAVDLVDTWLVLQDDAVGSLPIPGKLPKKKGWQLVLPSLRIQWALTLRQLVEVDGQAPKFPRPDAVQAGVNPFWPMAPQGFSASCPRLGTTGAIHLGPASAARVKELEAVRNGDDNFWRLANSLRFDSWSERDLVIQVEQECLELTGVRPDRVGCSLAVVCGKTGRDAGRRAQPAFLLEYQGASIAWFQQRCVRTINGHRWPDSILVVSRNGQRKTLVAELDGPEFHRSRWREVRRDAELGLPVVHIHPAVLQQPDGLRRILDWAVSQVA